MIHRFTQAIQANVAGNFTLPLGRCFAARFRMRVSNPLAPQGALDGFNSSPMLLFLSESVDGLNTDAIIVMGNEIVQLNPEQGNYFGKVSLPSAFFGHWLNVTGDAQLYLDVVTADRPEDVQYLVGGSALDTWGNARVASFKRWRILTDTGLVNATTGIGGSIHYDTGDCSEITVFQEQGNGTATGTLSIFPVTPFGNVGPLLASTNYGTPALSGQPLLSLPGDPADGLNIPPAIVMIGGAVAGGTQVRLSVVGR